MKLSVTVGLPLVKVALSIFQLMDTILVLTARTDVIGLLFYLMVNTEILIM